MRLLATWVMSGDSLTCVQKLEAGGWLCRSGERGAVATEVCAVCGWGRGAKVLCVGCLGNNVGLLG